MNSEAEGGRNTSALIGPRIVVGVDGSASSMRALAWAAAEAQLRGAALEVAHVDFARREALEALAPRLLDAERSVLEGAVVRAKALAPGILVTGRMCEPPAGAALLAASDGTEMLVVGSRGLSRLKRAALGSVSRECADRAICPVVIVRAPIPEPAPDARKGLDGSSTRSVQQPVTADV